MQQAAKNTPEAVFWYKSGRVLFNNFDIFLQGARVCCILRCYESNTYEQLWEQILSGKLLTGSVSAGLAGVTQICRMFPFTPDIFKDS